METVSAAIARSLGTHVRLSLTADGGRLHVVVPKRHVSPELHAAFGQRKNAILDVLHGWPDGACFACGETLCWFSWDECLMYAHCYLPADVGLVMAWISIMPPTVLLPIAEVAPSHDPPLGHAAAQRRINTERPLMDVA